MIGFSTRTLLSNYLQLLESYSTLNLTTHELLSNYGTLLGNHIQLLESYGALNASYREHLLDYSELQTNYTSLLFEHTQNIRSLIYVFIATATIFIIAAAYLSTHAHRRVSLEANSPRHNSSNPHNNIDP